MALLFELEPGLAQTLALLRLIKGQRAVVQRPYAQPQRAAWQRLASRVDGLLGLFRSGELHEGEPAGPLADGLTP